MIEFMGKTAKEGLSKEAQKHIKQSVKEIKQGKARRFKNAKEAILWLHSER